MSKAMRETAIEVAGTRLRTLEAGEGRPVLFLHGAAGAQWSPLLEQLAARCRVIAPEHPGFGRTQVPEWMMSTGDVAFFYLDVLRALDLDDVDLVGHCLGGWIAAEVAIRSTARLRTLTLLAPAGVAHADAPFDDIFAWGAEEFAQRHFHDRKLAAEWQQVQAALDIDVVLQNRTALARLAWSPRLANPQLPYWLHLIDVPTLLIWGEDDRVTPFACREVFLREIANAELFALPKSGHALPIERAKEIGGRLTAFLQGARG
jgi:pimeloyl-ACP methyl ester carboxylesterase